jgi:uncharacterized protein (DUF305 family)
VANAPRVAARWRRGPTDAAKHENRNKEISMTIRTLVFTVALSCGLPFATVAQQSQGAMQMPAPFELPAECPSPGSSGGMMQGGNMHEPIMQHMQSMMGNMDEAHKAYAQSMMKMHQPMMQGMMAKDPDVAFICMMIPHHMGAIENARIELKHGSNAEAKKMAEKTMKEQEKEIAEMKEWLQKNAKKESK